MQVEKEDDRANLGARQSARSQTRPEQRTLRKFCFHQESWIKQALENLPKGLHARMELGKPAARARLMPGFPPHQCLVKVGVNVEKCALRTHTNSALYAVTGWDDPLSFTEWRLTGAYFFGFSLPTFLLAETEQERQCPCGKELDEGGHHVQCCARAGGLASWTQ